MVTAPQGRVLFPQCDYCFCVTEQVCIPFAFIPRERLAAIRVVPAVQSDLVTVINAGSAYVSEHEKPRQFERVFVVVRDRDKTRHIVAVQEIKL